MKNTLLLLAAPALLLVACKKNDDTPPAPASQRIVGAWMKVEDKTTTTVNGAAAAPDTDNMPPDACAKDDLFNFLSNGMLVQTEGASKCRQSDSDTVGRGFYSLTSDNTQVIFKDADGSPLDTFNIVELSNSTMRLQTKDSTNISNKKIVVSDHLTYTKK